MSESFRLRPERAHIQYVLTKIIAVGDRHWRTYDVPDSIQLEEYSTSSGNDDVGYKMSEVFTVNVYWNSDDKKWNVNANPLDDNRWNAGNRAFSSNLKRFSCFTI